MPTVNLDRLTNLPPLGKGAHHLAQGACMMEAAAYVAGEPWSDRPACVCSVIAAFARGINDAMPDEATRDALLRPLIPLVIGTRGTQDDERRRAFIAADFAVCEVAPLALRAVGLGPHADTLAELPRIIDMQTAADAAAAYADAAAYAARAAYAADAAARAAPADAPAIWQSAADCIRRMCEAPPT